MYFNLSFTFILSLNISIFPSKRPYMVEPLGQIPSTRRRHRNGGYFKMQKSNILQLLQTSFDCVFLSLTLMGLNNRL